MISIIICSRHSLLQPSLSQNIEDTVGISYEIVHIDNSDNRYSIFSAYNEGIRRSKYSHLCFVHEDVEFLTANWGEKIINRLNLPDVGFIGVAGGKGALRVPIGWTAYMPVVNIIHSHTDDNNITIDKKELKLIAGSREPQPVILLDGVFLCANKALFEKCAFDESIGGFHGYDLDICIGAVEKGYINYVVSDIDIRHYSTGNFGVDYLKALFRIQEKREGILPLFEPSCKTRITPKELYKAEKNALSRLRKRMVRSGMPFADIIPIVRKYTWQTGSKFDKLMFAFIKLQLIIIRQVSVLRKLMIHQKM